MGTVCCCFYLSLNSDGKNVMAKKNWKAGDTVAWVNKPATLPTSNENSFPEVFHGHIRGIDVKSGKAFVSATHDKSLHEVRLHDLRTGRKEAEDALIEDERMLVEGRARRLLDARDDLARAEKDHAEAVARQTAIMAKLRPAQATDAA